MKIFITGITSFLGKAFIPKLLEKLSDQDKIYCLVRKDLDFIDKKVQLLHGILENIEKYDYILKEVDYVFHFAANATFGSNEDYFRVNYQPTKKMVEILKENKKLKNFIYLSSIGAFDRHKSDNCRKPINNKNIPSPRSLYGKSKLFAEKCIKESGIPYTIIRPTWIYGKDMRSNSHINKFVSMVVDNKKIMHFGFKGKVSLIHVEDLANALVNALNNEKIICNEYFGSSESLSIGEIFRIIYNKINNKEIKQIGIPSFYWFFSKVHSILPLTVANLFLDYLCAQDDDFWKDFNLHDKKTFKDGVDDVIKSNIRYAGKYVITGANSGIGLALAKLLVNAGKKLILIDKDSFNLEMFKNHEKIICDLSDLSQIRSLAKRLSSEKIFCLINNAGIGLKGNFADLDCEKMEEVVKVNITAPLYLTKLLIDNLIKNESIIVNVISSIAFNPLPGMSIYSASKAFLNNWSESISYELRKTNTVITFSPSGTKTNFQKNAGVKILNDGKGLLSPEYVARKILESIKKKKKVVILGFGTKILLFISKLLPRTINILFWGKLLERYR